MKRIVVIVFTACIILFNQSMFAQGRASLLELNANPPEGTTSVKYFIDDMQVSELTSLYAEKTNSKPVWKTVIDPAWIGAGEHTLKIEATGPRGTVLLETKKIQGAKMLTDEFTTSLTGAWSFADSASLPPGALEGNIPDAVKPGYKKGNWRKVLVPNSLGAIDSKWNVYEGMIGVYHREVDISSAKAEQVFLLLKSFYWKGRVFINGKEAGSSFGGYLPLRLNISNLIKQGKNDIAIITDNRFSTMGAFKRINEFYWNWGGLIQEVLLEKRPAVSLADLRAEGSLNGNLVLHAASFNNSSSGKTIKLSAQVFDAGGKTVAGPTALNATLPKGTDVIEISGLRISNVIPWELEKPYLYTVMIKGDFGSLSTKTGFRDVSVHGADLYINNKIVEDLQGFNRHADYPGLGKTQPAALVYQELKMLHDKGFRLFRPAHYPTTPEMLDAADELGFLVLEEVNVTGLRGAVMATKEVKDFGAEQLTKMIHRDRGHPSVFAFSVGNENFTEEEGAADYVRSTIAVGRALDPRRLFTQVTHRHTTDKTFEYQDFVAQNYYAGWYAKDINAIVTLFDAIQAYAGNKPVLLSEYGAEAVPGKEGTTKSTEFYQGFVVDAHNRLLNDRRHMIGKMYWCSTDFWCRPNWTGGSPEPIPPFHVKSLIDLYRVHKKLGWRVMFSPIRLIFNPHTVKANDLGGDIEIVAGRDTAIRQVITIKDIRNKTTRGTLTVTVPSEFKTDISSYPFTVPAGGAVSVTVYLRGKLDATSKPVECFFKAVVDEDTEAQPLLLNIRPAPPKQ
jgi:hypothetical protein